MGNEEIADELLSALRDALGPEDSLPEPRPDYARYGHRSVTVIDGAGDRVEVTARLTSDRLIESYEAKLYFWDRDENQEKYIGPLRRDCSTRPDESPSLTRVLPLVAALDAAAARLYDARMALRGDGLAVEFRESRLIVRESGEGLQPIVATAVPDPLSGVLRVKGRSAERVRDILFMADVF